LPRPQQAAVCFGLGKVAIPWLPLCSADEYQIRDPGRRDSRYRSNHLPWANFCNAFGVKTKQRHFMTSPYDALLILSFGGPESRDDVMPFLENVLRGRNVPRERMLEVAEHYFHFDGVSPINAQCRALIAALRQEFAARGPELPIYWGNRNWHPLLADTLSQMQHDGIRNALAFATSAYSSFSSCRQYLGDIERARASLGDRAPQIRKLRPFFNHPEFVGANVDHGQRALRQIPAARLPTTHLVFTAHSIPDAMAAGCDYEQQLNEVGRLVAERLGSFPWKIVYQSRSGPPTQPWLEPDVCVYLRQLQQTRRVTDVVVMPIGFTSDHMEVMYDLDVEAQQVAGEIDLNLVRAQTAGTHPRFMNMVRELVLEQTEGMTPRFIGELGPRPNPCAEGCCPSGR
jgi:ferrochelatase